MKKIIKVIDKVFVTLADCVVPVIPILIGTGMLKVVLIVIGPSVLNILEETSNTYIVMSFVAEAGYYFLPIYVAVSSAEHLQTNKYIAALMGGMLVSPKFVELVNQGVNLSVFNLPISPIKYGNEILPSIIIVLIEKYIYSFIDKYVIEKLRNVFTPLLTIIVMMPIAYCAVGPFGALMSKGLTNLILALSKIGPLGNAIFTALLPFVIIFGLGGADLAAILSMASTGVDPICFFGNVIYNSVLGFVALAVYLKDKKAESLAASIAATIGGASEPAIYGIVMKDKKALISTVAGGFAGGFMAGLFQIKSFAVASFGILGIVTTIGPNSSILLAGVSIIVGCFVGFITCFLLHKNSNHPNQSV